MSKGYVYCLSNPSMPGIVKIGRSIRGGQGRADALYRNDTGVALPFELEFEIMVDDCVHCERWMHNLFLDVRLNSNREFFKLQVSTCQEALLSYVAESIDRRLYNPIWEEVVNASGDDWHTVSAAVSKEHLLSAMDDFGLSEPDIEGGLNSMMKGNKHFMAMIAYAKVQKRVNEGENVLIEDPVLIDEIRQIFSDNPLKLVQL